MTLRKRTGGELVAEREAYCVIPLAEFERRHIDATFVALGCNVAQTARLLGIARNRLYRKLKSYGIAFGVPSELDGRGEDRSGG